MPKWSSTALVQLLLVVSRWSGYLAAPENETTYCEVQPMTAAVCFPFLC
jgi:hypothetical protein